MPFKAEMKTSDTGSAAGDYPVEENAGHYHNIGSNAVIEQPKSEMLNNRGSSPWTFIVNRDASTQESEPSASA